MIRGIGAANVVLAGSGSSLAMYIDGVYLARPSMAFAQFLDLDRIESCVGRRAPCMDATRWVGRST